MEMVDMGLALAYRQFGVADEDAARAARRGLWAGEFDTRKGERWLCTEDEARAAGWRVPQG